LEAADEVIIPEPYYTTYPATFTSSGAVIKSIPCLAEDQFQVNVDGILNAISNKTRAIVLNSPNNPTGAVYEKDRVAAIVQVCVQNNIWLICDDVYADLVDPDQLCCAASMPQADQVVVTVSSLSKSHRMTGWRLGWAIAPRPLTRHFYNLNMCMNYGLVGFIQDAAITALELSNEITPVIRENINQRRNVLMESLSKIPRISAVPSSAGMFVMLDVRALNISGQDFCNGLLDEYDVALIPCDGFGESGVGLIRVSACDSPQRLRQASERIAKYVASLS
jgi:arginine:pyruvate transaminase